MKAHITDLVVLKFKHIDELPKWVSVFAFEQIYFKALFNNVLTDKEEIP